MENNKQNTALLVVIAVATLLVAVVGATFAYFTASSNKGSTSIIEVTGGKMEIAFSDNSDAVNLTKKEFEPSNDVLITKTFTLTGTNTSIGKVNKGTGKGMDMPYTIELEYQNGFTTGQLHYSIARTDSNTSVTSSLDALGTKTKNGTLTKTVTGKNAAGQDNNTISAETNTNKTNLYESLVTGVFPAVENDKGNAIGFTFTMTFPDTGTSQDENKGADFVGKIIVNRNVNSNKGTTSAA